MESTLGVRGISAQQPQQTAPFVFLESLNYRMGTRTIYDLVALPSPISCATATSLSDQHFLVERTTLCETEKQEKSISFRITRKQFSTSETVCGLFIYLS